MVGLKVSTGETSGLMNNTFYKLHVNKGKYIETLQNTSKEEAVHLEQLKNYIKKVRPLMTNHMATMHHPLSHLHVYFSVSNTMLFADTLSAQIQVNCAG